MRAEFIYGYLGRMFFIGRENTGLNCETMWHCIFLREEPVCHDLGKLVLLIFVIIKLLMSWIELES